MTNTLDPEIQRILEDHIYVSERKYYESQDALKQAAMNQIARTLKAPIKHPTRKHAHQSGSVPTINVVRRPFRISTKILKALYKCSQEIIHAFQDEEHPTKEISQKRQFNNSSTQHKNMRRRDYE